MATMTDLATILRGAGLPVREIAGWKTRGHGAMSSSVLGILCHHTAGAANGAYPSENIVVNGRPDLAGPLANLGLDRNGQWIVIAAGQAWHAGTGSISWCPTNEGNAHLIGIEAESVGTRDDWTSAQRESYPRGAAALLRAFGLPAARAIAHREWAPTRKIDPAFWDMDAFRGDVARWMNTTPSAAATPTPARSLPVKDDAMYIKCKPYADKPDVWVGILSGSLLIGLGSTGEKASADLAIKAGATEQWVEKYTWDALDQASHRLHDNPRPVTVHNLPVSPATA